MFTRIMNMEHKSIEIAARFLKNDEIVAIPTETVYGLAGNGLSPAAVNKIFKAKGRPNDNPLILHIPKVDWFYEYADTVPDLALLLAEKFCPGPLTMIMPKKKLVPYETSGGLDTVAFRIPNNPWTLELIEACGFPLAAPSANLSGLPSPTKLKDVFNDMNGKIPLIIDGGRCSYGVESTVITFTEKGVKILRPGGVTPEMLSEFCEVEIDKAVTEGLKDTEKAISPGMKYKHYSPKADVVMIEGNIKAFTEYVENHMENGVYSLIYDGDTECFPYQYMTYGRNSSEQAHWIFQRLRELDEIGAKKVFVRAPAVDGVGLAVYNRLIRAAGFEVIRL